MMKLEANTDKKGGFAKAETKKQSQKIINMDVNIGGTMSLIIIAYITYYCKCKFKML